jgi:cytochrome c biogenesis protein CcmG/thiol:disulfide interchange protein DsbE
MRRAQFALYVLAGVSLVAGTAMVATAALRPAEQPLTGLLAAPPDPPEMAPDFSISLLDGTEFSLSEHLATDGRPILLNFWASWCFPCREEMPALDEAATLHPEVLFLGIAVEDITTEAEAFAEEIDVGYPLAIDETGIVAARYPFLGLPTTWLIDSDGRIVRQISGAMTLDFIEEVLEDL